MLRDAALMLLNLVDELEKDGYTLKDGHPWNIVFDGAKPIWVDLTSVAKVSTVGTFPARTDFVNYFLKALNLFSSDLAPFARLGLTQWLSPPEVWLNDRLSLQMAKAFSGGRRKGYRFATRMGATALWKKVTSGKAGDELEMPSTTDGFRKIISDLATEPASGEWTSYYHRDNELPEFHADSVDFKSLIQSTPKHQTVYSTIKELRPDKLLDIGCNTGLYGLMAESLGTRVIGFDTDESAVDQMYRLARDNVLNISSACGDFVTPMRAADYQHKPRVRPLYERMRADTVLCLAVVHHWVFKRTQLQFDDVVALLSSVTKKALIVEFVPPDDKHIKDWITPEYSWYSMENFVKELRREFAHIDVHESFPEPRKLLVCKR